MENKENGWRIKEKKTRIKGNANKKKRKTFEIITHRKK
jgi:hypothetical protein